MFKCLVSITVLRGLPVNNLIYEITMCIVCDVGSNSLVGSPVLYLILLFLQKIQRLCRLPFFDVRLFVKKLKSKNLVQEVFEDIAKIRVVW